MFHIEEKTITAAEWEIMRIIWNKGSVTAQESMRYLAKDKGWKMSTVKTLLARLVKKQMITIQTEGKQYRYFPIISQTNALQYSIKELFSRVCAREAGSLLTTILDSIALTEADVAQLSVKLEQLQPVAEIACDCLPGQCCCKKK